MNKGLSNREKVLLLFLAVFMFAFLSAYFLIMPLTKWKAETAAELEAAQMAQLEASARVSAVDGLRQSIEKTKEAVARDSKNIADFDVVEVLEKEFTEFCQENELIPISIILKNDEYFDGGGLLVKYNIQIKAEGNVNDLLKLSDYINNKYSFRLLSAEFGDNQLLPAFANYVVEAVLKLEAE